MKLNEQVVRKFFLSILAMGCLFSATQVFAISGDIGTIANNIRSNFTALAQLITAASYICGFGFAFAAILKFKAHKDNPQQIPVGTPIALLFIAAALIFLPSVFTVSGKTVFGGSGTVGGVSGTTIVPGFSGTT